jgi:hypothetical protein
MPRLPFVEPLLKLTAALDQAGIPYAIGGAIAYGVHAEPRATSDIDINIFLPETEGGAVLDLLAGLGITVESGDRDDVRQTGQARLHWGEIIVDPFFATVPFLDSARHRAIRLEFEGQDISFLSAEDLTICKVLFDRPKDWGDVRNIVAIQGDDLDYRYVRKWLGEMLGPDDGRVRRFDDVVAEVNRQLRELEEA